MLHRRQSGGTGPQGGAPLLDGGPPRTGCPEEPPRSLLLRHPVLRSAIVAVGAVVLALLGGRLMGVDDAPLQLALLPAILVAAIVGGLPGGLLATGVCLLAALVWVVHLRPTAQDAMALAMLAVVGALISVLAGLYRAARERLADYERDRVVRETQQEFRAFFENAAVGAAQIDLSGRHVFVNERYCAITGYTREELAAMAPADLSPPAEREAERAVMARLMRGELTSREVEKHYVRKDGREIWVHVTASLIRDDQGRPLRAAAVIADITQRHVAEAALRESELQFHALADNIAQLAWMADERGTMLWCSRRWYEYTGLRADDTRDAGWLSIVHPDERQRVKETVAAGIAAGQPFDSTFRMRGRDGSYRWFLTRVVPVKDDAGQVIRWFGTNTDVTAQRDEQQALEQADRRKNDFLAMLSHELRNPLAPIRNSVYVLQRTAPGSAQAERALGVIERQVQHMARLVDDLLDVTRIGRGKIRLQRERVELGSVLRRVVEDHRDEFTHAGIALETALADEALYLDGDPTRIAQIAGNLLHNALKFTPRGGTTRLGLRRDGREAELRVSDTGSGITADVLERLFEPFVQGERTLDRSRGGLGLGLALVKGIAELHGGRVAAQSAGPGQGASFTVRLPLEPARGDAALAAGRQRPHAARRVLVIEDDFDSARSLKEALELSGHRVELAFNGPEGLDAARRFDPDVVVCDIGLPGMDGFEVARELRREPQTRRAALVALSGFTLEEDLERCRSAGFDRHVAKPADPAAVEMTVASLTA